MNSREYIIHDVNTFGNMKDCKIEVKVEEVPTLLELDIKQESVQASNDWSISEKLHPGKKPFQCSQCEKSFAQRIHLVYHQRAHIGEKPFQCSHCDKCFALRAVLVIHERTHIEEKPFHCSQSCQCDIRFSQKSFLLRHEITHTGEKTFQCSQCEKRFAHRSSLVNHQKLHTGEKTFQCIHCDKTFPQKSDLLTHERTHTGVKPFQCSQCEKRYAHRSSLVNHQKLHTGEKTFQCIHCDKTFPQKSDLLIHKRTHIGEKPYQCSQCEQSFAQKSHLTTHKRTHTEERKYFNGSNMGRTCLNSPDTFCYMCGDFTPERYKYPITTVVKDAYKQYFGISIIDQDKPWAPHVVCKACAGNLSRWMHGKQYSGIRFASPMAWSEPTDHSIDCYFCLTETFGFNIKNRSNIVYPDIATVRRPVPRGPKMSPPNPPNLPLHNTE